MRMIRRFVLFPLRAGADRLRGNELVPGVASGFGYDDFTRLRVVA